MRRVKGLAIAILAVGAAAAAITVLSMNRQPANSPSCATFDNRWSDFAAGGPADGPIQMVLEAEYTLPPDTGEASRVKVPILVDPDTIELIAVTVMGPDEIRFSHTTPAPEFNSAEPQVDLEAQARMNRPETRADFPGHRVCISTPGSYELWARTAGQTLGLE